jgi:ubiquinone/menaquinone biosynthesis C-methylase UbiE
MTLVDLLLSDTSYPDGALVLEAGCGVGAQTITLAKNTPRASIISVDISDISVKQAEQKVRDAGFTNVQFRQVISSTCHFAAQTFDHVFVCFVLEHLNDPVLALKKLKDIS